jgi:hypothetical protein
VAIDSQGGKTVVSPTIRATPEGTMPNTVIAAVLVLLVVVAVLWTIFPLDGPTEEGQPPLNAIDQSE